MLAVSKCFLLFALILPIAVRGRILESEERETKSEDKNFTFTMNQATRDDEPPFQFINPTYYGNGCPRDSIEVVIPDFAGEELTTVTILFSEYIASTSDSLLRDRKSCNMALPVQVKPGLSVGIFQVDYRGNAYVPPSLDVRKTYAKFDAEYFFSGIRGPRVSRTYTGSSALAFEDNFFESDTIGAIVWSKCGGTTNFRINTSITASKQNFHDEDVSIQVDSEDIQTDGFSFGFTSRRC